MKIVLVDDHHLIREGLRPLLQRLTAPGEALEVVEASTYAAALAELARHADADLLLLDLRLPDVSGFDALTELVRRHPGVPVVIMSGEHDAVQVRTALQLGALGYIPKSSTPQVIVQALRLVLSGGTYVPPEILDGGAPAATAKSTGRALDLTPRQLDVLRCLVAGRSNKEICRELDLAEGTVKAHIAAIFRALDVTTRVQAVIAAGKLGIKA